jgi:translation initiation factor 1
MSPAGGSGSRGPGGGKGPGGKSKGGWTDAGGGGGSGGGGGGSGGFNSPFAGLGALRAQLPGAADAAGGPPAAEGGGAATPAAASSSPAPAPKGPARAVVRLERKGRGGKEVTVVEGLGLPAAQLEVWLKALKGALGCGGAVEEDALLLQGDQRERLPALLTGRGVRKVSVG